MSTVSALFTDQWVWALFMAVGLLLVLLELIAGVDTGLDMVFLGSAFVLGGLVTWPFHSWILTLLVTGAISLAYVAIGRRYVHRLRGASKTVTNVDAMVGKTGVVLKALARNSDGLVKVGHEQWRARASEEIAEGVQVVVAAINGVTLVVEKPKGGQST